MDDTVVGGLIGLGGVALGVLLSTILQRNVERQRWHRDLRLDAYVRFFQATSEYHLPERGPDGLPLTGNLDPLANAFQTVTIVGSGEVVELARELFSLALERKSDAHVQWEFVHAAREDLGLPMLEGAQR